MFSITCNHEINEINDLPVICGIKLNINFNSCSTLDFDIDSFNEMINTLSSRVTDKQDFIVSLLIYDNSKLKKLLLKHIKNFYNYNKKELLFGDELIMMIVFSNVQAIHELYRYVTDRDDFNNVLLTCLLKIYYLYDSINSISFCYRKFVSDSQSYKPTLNEKDNNYHGLCVCPQSSLLFKLLFKELFLYNYEIDFKCINEFSNIVESQYHLEEENKQLKHQLELQQQSICILQHQCKELKKNIEKINQQNS